MVQQGDSKVLIFQYQQGCQMIKLEDVTKVYKGEVLALRDASCDIQRGEFVFLVGQSGSGK